MRSVPLLLLAASVSLSCGTGNHSNRRLQSSNHQWSWKRRNDSIHSNWKLLRTATDRDSAAGKLGARMDGATAEKSAVQAHGATVRICLPRSGPEWPITVVAPADPTAPQSGTLPFSELVLATGPIACLQQSRRL